MVLMNAKNASRKQEMPLNATHANIFSLIRDNCGATILQSNGSFPQNDEISFYFFSSTSLSFRERTVIPDNHSVMLFSNYAIVRQDCIALNYVAAM